MPLSLTDTWIKNMLVIFYELCCHLIIFQTWFSDVDQFAMHVRMHSSNVFIYPEYLLANRFLMASNPDSAFMYTLPMITLKAFRRHPYIVCICIHTAYVRAEIYEYRETCVRGWVLPARFWVKEICSLFPRYCLLFRDGTAQFTQTHVIGIGQKILRLQQGTDREWYG